MQESNTIDTDYIPDAWVVITIKDKDKEPIYKILSGWYGGYTTGDSWRLSSGIIKYTEFENYYKIINLSGSVYDCFKRRYGLISITASILKTLEEAAKDQGFSISTCYITDIK